MRYKAILFDFDGTLADDLGFFVKAYDYALKKYNIRLSAEEIASLCFGKQEEEITAKMHLPSAEEFRNYYFEGIKKIFANVPLFPGVTELLEKLKKEHIKLGLVSFARKWYINMMLEQTKLTHFFQSIFTFNDVTNPKPDPEAIMLSSKKLNVNVSDILSAGDSRNDILMGKAAGCDSALFLPKGNKPYYDFVALRKLNPEYEFATYEELKKILYG